MTKPAERDNNAGVGDGNAGAAGNRQHGASVSQAVAPAPPRLLNLKAAAAYLSVSPWTIRDLEAAGTLKRVSIPVGRKDLRKLLFDRIDLDELIARWKTA